MSKSYSNMIYNKEKGGINENFSIFFNKFIDKIYILHYNLDIVLKILSGGIL